VATGYAGVGLHDMLSFVVKMQYSDLRGPVVLTVNEFCACCPCLVCYSILFMPYDICDLPSRWIVTVSE